MLRIFTLHWLCVDNPDCFKSKILPTVWNAVWPSFLGPIFNSWNPHDHDKVNDHPWGSYVMKLTYNTPDYPRVKLDMAIDHIITYPIIYLLLLHLQDLRNYYRLKNV